MAQTKEIYWHLPGLCYSRFLNHALFNLMQEYPEKFREGYKIGSVYGTIPGAIWNGGRSVFGMVPKHDIEKVIKSYNDRGIPARFTWTNSLLTEKHVYDTYCNLIMQVADNGMNQVLVNRDCLEEYLRQEYPNFKVISSTTKRMTDMAGLKEELEKDYHLVVLDYDLNHDEVVLKELQPYADRIEILVNEICYPNCPMRAQHYQDEARAQLEYDTLSKFQCPNKSTPRVFAECMKRPAFISNEQIGEYIERGYVNFKIVGRGLPQDFVKESYLYFLVKDEEREFIRRKMDAILAAWSKPAPGKR
ncbi:MAG: hypothetical protein IJN16_03155 [Lachnospiraceae bacterium]|nr:hypothetical protein [Lachnospiraceae bacterium]